MRRGGFRFIRSYIKGNSRTPRKGLSQTPKKERGGGGGGGGVV